MFDRHESARRLKFGLQTNLGYKTTKNMQLLLKPGRTNVVTVLTTFRELHEMYNIYPNDQVSMGTFYALKPFHIRHPTAKDLIMC